MHLRRSSVTLLALPVLVWMLLSAHGCSRNAGPPRELLVDAVRYYNAMLIRCYMEVNIDLMKDIATERQVSMIFPVLAALRAEGNLMRANQTSFSVRDVSTAPERAFVETEEGWDYWWEMKDTGTITKPKQQITYRIRYNLVQQGTSWKVDSIETVD